MFQSDAWSFNRELLEELSQLVRCKVIPRSIGVGLTVLIEKFVRLTSVIVRSPSAQEIFEGIAHLRQHPLAFRSNTGKEVQQEFEDLLMNLDLDPKRPVVAILNRDTAYLERRTSKEHSAKNTFRNCRIENYATAARILADYGFNVVRVGAEHERPFEVDHPRIVDYSFSVQQSDRNDVLLAKLSRAILSPSSGLDLAYHLFGSRVCMVNVPFSTHDPHAFMSLTKHLIVETNGAMCELPVASIAHPRCTWVKGMPFWDDKPIRFQECSPAEIGEVANLLAKHLQGEDVVTDSREAAYWLRFWEMMTKSKAPAYLKICNTPRLPASMLDRFFEADIVI